MDCVQKTLEKCVPAVYKAARFTHSCLNCSLIDILGTLY